jgi:hypothetical protein
MYVTFEMHVSRQWCNVKLLGEVVGTLVKYPSYQSAKWTVEDNGKNVSYHGYDCFTLRLAKDIARKHFAKKLLENNAPLTRHSVCTVNRTLREVDESHKWPILDEFNATERAIRRLRRQRQYVEFSCVAEYKAALKYEISQIVNSAK